MYDFGMPFSPFPHLSRTDAVKLPYGVLGGKLYKVLPQVCDSLESK